MPHVRQHNNAKHYVVDARDIGGGEHRFSALDEAEAACEKWRRESADGRFIRPSAAVRFRDCVNAWMDEQYRRVARGEVSQGELSNMEVSCRHIWELVYDRKQIGKVRVTDLAVNKLQQQIVPQLFRGRAHKTARNILGHFKSITKLALLSGWISTDPSAPLRCPLYPAPESRDITSVITRANIRAIIAAADRRHQLPIEFAALTGLRAGEQAALTWEHISFGKGENDGIVHVCRARKKDGFLGKPKTNAGRRTVALAPSLWHALRRWQLAPPHEQRSRGLVFPSCSGGLASADSWRKRGLHPACDRAGVDRIRWHDLRHFFASILIYQLDAGDATVAQLLGHRDTNFTRRVYGKWLADCARDQQIAQKIGAAISRP